jgi:hypothetical protein
MKAKFRLASKAKPQAATLAAKCEAMAREAEAAIKMAATDEARQSAQDQARLYLRMALDWHATATRAEEITPSKFAAKNKGPQSKTAAKLRFVRAIAAECEGIKRQTLALKIWDHSDAKLHFETYEAVYRFLGRREFF